MKILHLIATPFFSGPTELVALLAGAQAELGHQVSVAVDRRRNRAVAEELAAPRLTALKLLDEGELTLSVKSSPLVMARDVLRLRRRELDVIHAHFSHDHALARLARRRPTVLVRSLHAPRSLRWSTPAADAYTTPVPGLAARLSAPSIVLDAIPGPEFRPCLDLRRVRLELGITGAKVIGMASTFKRSRRHELGLEAFALVRRRVPSARLLLLGDGELRRTLEAKASALDLSGSVTFAGYHSGASFAKWLGALDELWILGLGNDFAGRLAVQGRACGVRVVTVDEGALSRWADTVIARASPAALCEASLAQERRPRALPHAHDVAREVLKLYERVGARDQA